MSEYFGPGCTCRMDGNHGVDTTGCKLHSMGRFRIDKKTLDITEIPPQLPEAILLHRIITCPREDLESLSLVIEAMGNVTPEACRAIDVWNHRKDKQTSIERERELMQARVAAENDRDEWKRLHDTAVERAKMYIETANRDFAKLQAAESELAERDAVWMRAIIPDDPDCQDMASTPEKAADYLRGMESDLNALLASEETPQLIDILRNACKAALIEFRSIRPHITAKNEEGIISENVIDQLEIAILSAEPLPQGKPE